MFDAYAYSLTPLLCNVCQIETVRSTTAEATPVTVSHTAPAADPAVTLTQEYMHHDAFAWGAKADETHSLGKAALDMVVALSTENDLTFAEIAERTGMSRSTASKKARALAFYGLVEIYMEGRTCVVYLVQDWRERLEHVWTRLTTFSRHLRRRVEHLKQRLDRLYAVRCRVTSGQLHKQLTRRLEAWRRKLYLLNRQLAELRALREALSTNR
jgi:DNA-binding transcriptional regulator GbsR (MarR family)